MKVAYVFYASTEARRRYHDAMRERLYAAGYLPYQATDAIRHARVGPLSDTYGGAGAADRAADVASEVRGVTYKLFDV